ncbi:hypothetical protein B484DRAFT_445412 [Ochromonadaceae sp. CCMP2298]|nr:hypothetical protein B484DRAFT_445412 [Ochromonadaceae sp. CCMP2298]
MHLTAVPPPANGGRTRTRPHPRNAHVQQQQLGHGGVQGGQRQGHAQHRAQQRQRQRGGGDRSGPSLGGHQVQGSLQQCAADGPAGAGPARQQAQAQQQQQQRPHALLLAPLPALLRPLQQLGQQALELLRAREIHRPQARPPRFCPSFPHFPPNVPHICPHAQAQNRRSPT